MIADRLLIAAAALPLLLVIGCASPPKPTPSAGTPPWRAEAQIGAFIQPPAGMSRDQAVSEITSRSLLLLGTPYRLGGSSPAEGLDCSGLVAHVVQEAFRIRFPRTTEEQATVGAPIPMHALAPGDLVFFNTTGRPNSHVGVYLGERRFVHAPTSRGVVRIESLTQDYWAKRFDQARRLIARTE